MFVLIENLEPSLFDPFVICLLVMIYMLSSLPVESGCALQRATARILPVSRTKQYTRNVKVKKVRHQYWRPPQNALALETPCQYRNEMTPRVMKPVLVHMKLMTISFFSNDHLATQYG